MMTSLQTKSIALLFTQTIMSSIYGEEFDEVIDTLKCLRRRLDTDVLSMLVAGVSASAAVLSTRLLSFC